MVKHLDLKQLVVIRHWRTLPNCNISSYYGYITTDNEVLTQRLVGDNATTRHGYIRKGLKLNRLTHIVMHLKVIWATVKSVSSKW